MILPQVVWGRRGGRSCRWPSLSPWAASWPRSTLSLACEWTHLQWSLQNIVLISCKLRKSTLTQGSKAILKIEFSFANLLCLFFFPNYVTSLRKIIFKIQANVPILFSPNLNPGQFLWITNYLLNYSVRGQSIHGEQHGTQTLKQRIVYQFVRDSTIIQLTKELLPTPVTAFMCDVKKTQSFFSLMSFPA